jgi:hypothetical protein
MAYVLGDPEALLQREALSDALKEKGYPVEKSTLATKASRGGGPPFRKFGRVPLYRWGDALEWAEAKLGPPQGSTSEGDRPVSMRPEGAKTDTEPCATAVSEPRGTPR